MKKPVDFASTSILCEKAPRLKNAVMVSGLPGVGLAGKLAVDHMAKEIGAKQFAIVYSPHFPNQVLAVKDESLKPFTMSLHYKKSGKRDVVFLAGDLQPITVEGQYEVAGKILSFFKSELKGSEVISLAGYSPKKVGKEPIVYCTATDKKTHDKMLKSGCRKNAAVVPIVGMAGLLPALAPAFGLNGTALLAETEGNRIDTKAASELSKAISKYAGIKVDHKKLLSAMDKSVDAITKIEHNAMLAAKQAQQKNTTQAVAKEVTNYIQ